MKRLLLLGATGSIGTTCLNALRNNLAEDIVLAGITAKDSPSLIDRAREFDVPYLYLTGGEGGKLSEFIEKTHPDIILNAIAGSDGLGATLECIKHSIPIALANKESVVMGGEFMLSQAKAFGTEIIPVDSEHSAIYHLLKAKRADRLIITASGGPLHHPTWSMGKKITIDSATLANKGLEVIEASLLFDFPAEKIDVTIHRQSIIHSAIETEEGAVYALLSTPDMTLPVLLALQGEGTGLKNVVKRLSFSTPLSLTFEGWDRERFPLLSLAYKTLEMGSYARIAYCQSDEIAVNAFLLGRIGFTEIASIVEETVMSMPASNVQSYEDIIRIKQIAKQKAEALC